MNNKENKTKNKEIEIFDAKSKAISIANIELRSNLDRLTLQISTDKTSNTKAEINMMRTKLNELEQVMDELKK